MASTDRAALAPMLNRGSQETLPEDAILRIAPTHRFQWEETQDCHVILYAEGMVKLNPSAAEILKLCDGTNNLKAIVEALRAKYPAADLEQDVRQFLQAAYDNGWLNFT